MDIIYRQAKWEYNSALISLGGTNCFPPGNGTHFGNWVKNAQLKNIIKKEQIQPYHKLKQRTELMILDEWRYSQLKHFMESLSQPIRDAENLNPMQQICNPLEKKKHLRLIRLSPLYSLKNGKRNWGHDKKSKTLLKKYWGQYMVMQQT